MGRDSLTKEILRYLAETSTGLLKLGVDVFVDPHQFLHQRRRPLPPRQRIDKVANVRRSSYFVQKDPSTFMLTSQGRIACIKLRVRLQTSNVQKTWDGLWRIVTYDVAELTRTQRDLLRHQLQTLGFAELQKSVLVTPASIEKELFTLLALWHIEVKKGDVRVIVAKTITKDADLKRRFGLGRKRGSVVKLLRS